MYWIEIKQDYQSVKFLFKDMPSVMEFAESVLACENEKTMVCIYYNNENEKEETKE